MIRPIVGVPFIVIALFVLLALLVYGAATTDRPVDRRRWVLRGLLVVLLGIVAMRPGLGTMPTATRVQPLEVLVFVDRTTSMSALDWDGGRSRLDGVRRDVSDLVTLLPSGRFTIVTFAREVDVELPSTQDESLIAETLGLVRREQVYDGIGSRLDRPRGAMKRLLERMKDQQPDRPRLVVLMSDGENTQLTGKRSFAPVEPLVDGGVVFGYGTQSGGRMPLDAGNPDRGWVIDATTDSPALSRLDEENLQAAAAQLGVGYEHRTARGELSPLTDSWIEEFADEGGEAGREVHARYELTWAFALGAFLLTLIELRRQWRRLLVARKEAA